MSLKNYGTKEIKVQNVKRFVFKRKLCRDIRSINSIIREMTSWLSHTEITECIFESNNTNYVPQVYESHDGKRYTILLETVCERLVKYNAFI